MTVVTSAPAAGRVVRPQPSRARVDAGVRLGALAALWLGLVLVTYWWTAGGGVQELGSWTDGLTSAGRLTGLLASVVARSLTWADLDATSAYALDAEAGTWLGSRPGRVGLVVWRDGRVDRIG